MQKHRKDSQQTIVQPWARVLVPPQGIYITIPLSSSARTKASTQVEDGNFRLSPRFLEPHLLPHHQPVRRKSHILQSSPQILPIKTLP